MIKEDGPMDETVIILQDEKVIIVRREILFWN